MPTPIAIELGLELRDVMNVKLANETIKQELLFAGTAKLGRKRKDVSILLTDSDDALLGTSMLSYLELDFVNQTVRIR